MNYYIYHWYGKSPPIPEAYKEKVSFTNFKGKDVDADDLHAFVEKHGPIQLRNPNGNFPYWSIYVTDSTRRFSQK